jgi:hypothetical protein
VAGVALTTSGWTYAETADPRPASDSVVLVAESSPLPHQRVEPKIVLVALRDKANRLSAKGSDLWEISELGSFDVPEAALRAYKHAATRINAESPSCDLPWTLLAAIGRVESDHGRYGGSVLGSDGLPRPAIRGVALNGVGPVAAIADSDNGRFDQDTVWDRAVGPMQFIPTTWAGSGRDGDGDGVADPNDIDDAALAAAGYLCPASGSIHAEGAMERSILAYNHSDYYVALVMAFEDGYRTGSFSIPSPPPPVEEPAERPAAGKPKPKPAGDRPKPDAQPKPKPEPDPKSQPQPEPQPKPKPKPDPKPAPGPKPKPKPKPVPPAETSKTGHLSHDGGGLTWLFDGQPLDLGGEARLQATSTIDFDEDGTLEEVAEELVGLVGLVGPKVEVTWTTGTSPLHVTAIAGYSY